MRPIPNAALDFIIQHEGEKLKAYQDSVGVWTVGVGHTGPDVKAGLTITRAKSRDLLRDDLSVSARRLEAKIGAVINDLTDHQYAALLSFVFNVGAGDGWTIWRRLKAKQFDQIPLELMKFVNAGGRKLQGLVNRRADEVKLWSTEEPGSVDDHPPSSVTRVIATPPTPSDPIPPQKSGTIIAAATGAVATVPVAVQQITAAVAPYADKSELIAKVVGTLAVIAAVAAVVGLVLAWLKNQHARG